MDGRCLCGAITYTVTADEPLATGLCHCTDCRRQTGTAFSVLVGVGTDDFHLSGDTPREFETMGEDREAVARRQFCGTCGSPIASILGDSPDIAWIKAGTLDDPTWIEPELEVWTDSRLPWVDAVEHEERGYFPRGLPT